MNDIEKLIEYIECHSNNFLGTKSSLRELETFEYFYNLLMDTLEKQLNSGWIPVSERLPEEGMKVLVVSNNDIPIYCVAIMMNGELRVTWNHDRFEHIKIVAWRSLPEPYMEASNGK